MNEKKKNTHNISLVISGTCSLWSVAGKAGGTKQDASTTDAKLFTLAKI